MPNPEPQNRPSIVQRLRCATVPVVACAAAWLLIGVDHAWCQDAPETRAELLKREREAQTVTPYQPTGLARAMDVAENRLQPLLVRDGVHWKLGSLTTGSGFAYGGGYRHRRLFDGQGAATVWAAASLKRYWAMEGRFALPDLADGRVALEAFARHSDYPREAFFGLGPDSRRSDHTSFDLRMTRAGGQAAVRPWRHLSFGGAVEWLRPRARNGTDPRVPPIEALFDPAAAPGLGIETEFIRTGATAEVDYRQPRNARRGGWYRLDASRYQARSAPFDFTRLEADLRQYLSAFAERRVVALRLLASTSTADAGSQVPFYLMPSLGGHDSLRGFRDYRFRGPHALLAQAEYRYEIWSGFDAALFYDAGKVADSRRDLDFRRLQHDYGVGFRFNTDNGVIFRVDGGFGSRDGRHLFIVFGDVF
jgi:outer membrane protein assembly factor BamA